MIFPDPNVGYVFGYASRIAEDHISITFLWGRVHIPLRFTDIGRLSRETYGGGRISWDVIRWGKCPPGTEALRVKMKKGILRDHLIVFDDLDAAIRDIRAKGLSVN